jgi:hypothetical protein
MTLMDAMTQTIVALRHARGVDKITKNPNLLRIGVGLTLLPEPLTTAVGVPLVAYSVSKKNSLRLGESLADAYKELWSSLSWY